MFERKHYLFNFKLSRWSILHKVWQLKQIGVLNWLEWCIPTERDRYQAGFSLDLETLEKWEYNWKYEILKILINIMEK